MILFTYGDGTERGGDNLFMVGKFVEISLNAL